MPDGKYHIVTPITSARSTAAQTGMELTKQDMKCVWKQRIIPLKLTIVMFVILKEMDTILAEKFVTCCGNNAFM
jgi:hypothetical protein